MSQFIEMFGDPYTGWKYPTERLGEVYNIGTGGTPDRKVYGYYEGQIPWVKSTEVSYCELYDTEEHISEQAIKDSNCSLYPSGTILLAMYGQGTTRGRVAQLRTDAAVNQAIAAIQVQDETESLFLYSMLKVCYDYVRNLAVGGNQHNLNLKLVSSIPLIVPPKELQLKFVSIAKQADKSGFDGRKSQFIEMFGDPITNPKEWPVMSMKESSLLLSDGPFGSNLKTEHYRDSGIRVIRLQNICLGYFDDKDRAYISLEHYEKLKKYTCLPGEIVIGTLGEPNFRACVIPDYIDLAINKADCVHYIPKKELLNNTFTCAYINCERTLQMATSNIHGTTRARIAAGQVNNIPIYIPPIELQLLFEEIAHQADKSGSVLQYMIAC